MKITKTQLKRIIKEELGKVMEKQYRLTEHWTEQNYYVPKDQRLTGLEGDQKEQEAKAAWRDLVRAEGGIPRGLWPGDVRGSEPFEHGGRTYGGKGTPDPEADSDDYQSALKKHEYSIANPRRKPYGGHGGGDPLGYASERRPSLRNFEENKK